jgi:N5-(cytidine 5'-diphosphoramidyl)-L-glutamine hydrolase
VRPLLVSQRFLSEEAYPELRAGLDLRWGPFLEQAGLLAIPAAPDLDPAALLAAVPACVGLLLTGGNDLAAVSTDPLSKARDAYEEALLAAVESAGLPVLGVCRGLQLLGFRDGYRLEEEPDHVATRHSLIAAKTSRWLGARGCFEVNSYHRWALRGAGESGRLRIAAETEDGGVEALETEAGPPLLGIMWHPEREEPFQTTDLELFDRFFGRDS